VKQGSEGPKKAWSEQLDKAMQEAASSSGEIQSLFRQEKELDPFEQLDAYKDIQRQVLAAISLNDQHRRRLMAVIDEGLKGGFLDEISRRRYEAMRRLLEGQGLFSGKRREFAETVLQLDPNGPPPVDLLRKLETLQSEMATIQATNAQLSRNAGLPVK
jgi:hypothetical protein